VKHAAKIALLAGFILRPGHWDDQADAWSKLLPHDWPGTHAETLGEKVKSGELRCLDLLKEGSPEKIGTVLYDIDSQFPQPEMVIVAAYSGANKFDVTAHCLPELEALAVSLGCATIRFNTMRAGLVAKTSRNGWRVSEIIMRKDVRHV